MVYYDNLGLTEWNCVFVADVNDHALAERWCEVHDSNGCYCYDWPYDNDGTGTNWYFENDEDAVLFALKFK